MEHSEILKKKQTKTPMCTWHKNLYIDGRKVAESRNNLESMWVINTGQRWLLN